MGIFQSTHARLICTLSSRNVEAIDQSTCTGDMDLANAFFFLLFLWLLKKTTWLMFLFLLHSFSLAVNIMLYTRLPVWFLEGEYSTWRISICFIGNIILS
ncbi:hypothetical protein MANES_11G072350v8 [Manihot esculenta]|uniref:Uncharacterized protein n=1 Tax=Manihot esculenta TaxID=3983 RepID=A0ACB7GVS5_MANES|nr:hypothetical protein MANES_11G072350v8 [Manihot esculenta]